MDERKWDVIIKQPWAMDRKNFSDRIWQQKEKLIQNLHRELTQNLIRGMDPQPSINRLAKTMQVSKQEAGRLIMTESAAIASTAQKKCFEDLEVKEYEIVATLDSRTSVLCQGLNGKVFKRKDYQVGETAPPFHPQCRSCTCPYFSDEFTIGEERAASDENGDVVKAKDYRNKFKHISNSKAVQETLYRKAMDILKHRSGTDYEDFYLINCQKGSVAASQTKVEYTKEISKEGKHNRVWYNEEIAKAIRKYPKNSFVTIHNHAGSNPPSGGDFEGAFVNGYSAGINVCHNGDLYYYKVGKKVFSGKLYDMTIDKFKTANDTIDTLTKDNADNEALQSEITGYKAEITRLEAVAESQKKEYEVREGLKKAGCNDPDYLIYKHGGVDKFLFDQTGIPIGIDEIAKGYKESLSYLFESKGEGNPKPPAYVPKGGKSEPQSTGKSLAESLNQETMKNPYQDAWAQKERI